MAQLVPLYGIETGLPIPRTLQDLVYLDPVTKDFIVDALRILADVTMSLKKQHQRTPWSARLSGLVSQRLEASRVSALGTRLQPHRSGFNGEPQDQGVCGKGDLQKERGPVTGVSGQVGLYGVWFAPLYFSGADHTRHPQYKLCRPGHL